MFDYLNECEEMLGAEECDQIKELIDVSDSRVKGHTNNYEELMRKVQELQESAVESMQSLSKHLDPDKQKIAKEAQDSVMKQRSDL